MVELPNMNECCGCSACYAVCPVRAISMQADAEGFLQPIVDEDVCIKCGRCEHVCPVLNSGEPRSPIAVYAAKAKDDELRRVSSSGGIFSLIARTALDKGGVVYGAAFENETRKVAHKRVVDEAGLDELRGSKYVQSELRDVFTQVKDDLINGLMVLFSGCPCQVAGLKRFLGKEYSNLLLVDVVCHAVPSPLAWKNYLSCQEHKEGARIARTFSRRNCAWRKFALSLEFCNSADSAYLVNPASDTFLRAFCLELFNRRSCYRCPSRSFRSGSDITISDFWGIEKIHPEINDDKGVSAVMCCTQKGLTYFSSIQDSVLWLPSSVESVSRCNKTVFGNHKPSRHRCKFFNEINDTNFDELVEPLLVPPLWYRILRWIKWHTIGKPKGT